MTKYTNGPVAGWIGYERLSDTVIRFYADDGGALDYVITE